ncbi:MAG TPA: DUF2490 domain-containing protein [Bacteroidia bacterium]|nr:DUF2490 domain-containing protein [Bacteroidia bacterium]
MKSTCAVVLFFFINAGYAYTQDYSDAGMWNTFNLEYSIDSKLTALFTQELRLRENLSRLNLLYTNAGIEYKFSKSVKASLVYRNIDKYQDDKSFSFRHRMMCDITYKNKIWKLIIAYRHRLQVEQRDIYSSEKGWLPEWYSRNKVTVKYDLEKRYTPYAAIEIRYQIHDPRNIESDKTLHRSRYVIGGEYKINNHSDFGVYYLIQDEYNVVTPQTLYIFGLEYNLSL